MRPRLAFFDNPDVFEDFYPHYKVTQSEFATNWSNTGSYAFLGLLQASLVEVTWFEFSLAPELGESVHRDTGIRIRFLRAPILHRLLWVAYYETSLSWRFPRSYRLYAQIATYLVNLSWRNLRELRQYRPDVLFIQDYSTGRFDLLVLLGRWMGVPVIAWHAGSRPDGYLGMWARKLTLKHAGAIIASSRDEAEMLVKRFAVPKERIRIILTPMDLETYHIQDRQLCRRKLNLPEDGNILLYVGRFDDPVKRITSMIHAIASLVNSGENLHFVLVGEGNDERRVRKHAAAKLGPRAHFAGWVPDAPRRRFTTTPPTSCCSRRLGRVFPA